MTKDGRPTLTLKGHCFTPEFRALINDAARAEGFTQAEWVHQVLRAAAQDVPARENTSTNDTRLDRLEEIVERLAQSLLPEVSPSQSESFTPPSVEPHYELQTPAEREALRQRLRREFVDLGVDVEDYSDGLILVNGRYVVSLLGKRWRLSGKGKWYWYRSPEQLVGNYIARKQA